MSWCGDAEKIFLRIHFVMFGSSILDRTKFTGNSTNLFHPLFCICSIRNCLSCLDFPTRKFPASPSSGSQWRDWRNVFLSRNISCIYTTRGGKGCFFSSNFVMCGYSRVSGCVGIPGWVAVWVFQVLSANLFYMEISRLGPVIPYCC